MPFYVEQQCECGEPYEGAFDFDILCDDINCPSCGKEGSVKIGWETEYGLEPIEDENE